MTSIITSTIQLNSKEDSLKFLKYIKKYSSYVGKNYKNISIYQIFNFGLYFIDIENNTKIIIKIKCKEESNQKINESILKILDGLKLEYNISTRHVDEKDKNTGFPQFIRFTHESKNFEILKNK